MKDKNSFILYKSFYPPISFLTLEQKGKLFDAIFRYQIDGLTVVDDDIKMPFLFFVNQFKVDDSKYEELCAKRRTAGGKGGAPKGNQNALKYNQNNQKVEIQPKQPIASETSKTTLNDNDNVNDNDINIDISISFDTFWDLYDKKVDRAACEKRWKKLSKSDKEAAINYIPKYKEAQPDKQFRKNPETYLNRCAWENEIIFREDEKGVNSGVIPKEGFKW